MCFGDNDSSENEISKFDSSEEINDTQIAALRNFMLNMPNAKVEVVDVLIEKFKKLNRDGKDIIALRDYMVNIPGAKAEAVDELIEIYKQLNKVDTKKRSYWSSNSTFRPKMMNSAKSLDGSRKLVS